MLQALIQQYLETIYLPKLGKRAGHKEHRMHFNFLLERKLLKFQESDWQCFYLIGRVAPYSGVRLAFPVWLSSNSNVAVFVRR